VGLSCEENGFGADLLQLSVNQMDTDAHGSEEQSAEQSPSDVGQNDMMQDMSLTGRMVVQHIGHERIHGLESGGTYSQTIPDVAPQTFSFAGGERLAQSAPRKTHVFAHQCIVFLLLVNLIVIIGHVFTERCVRWCYPMQFLYSQSEQLQNPEKDSFTDDFRKVRVILQASQIPLFTVRLFAVFLYVLQDRVMQLTHKRGEPPEWVEYCMLTTCILMIGSVIVSCFLAGTSNEKRPGFFGMLYFSKQLIQIITLLLIAALVYAIFTITPEDCLADGKKSIQYHRFAARILYATQILFGFFITGFRCGKCGKSASDSCL
jgi:hypothetical protein